MKCVKWLLLLTVIFTISCAGAALANVEARLFSPTRDYTGETRYYVITVSEEIRNATLVRVENPAGAAIYQNVPMLINGGIYATTQIPLTLPNPGEYRFHVGVTSITGFTSFFTFTVRSETAAPGLRNVTISHPPYHVDHSFEILASFTVPPRNVVITLEREGIRSPVTTVSNVGGLEVVGYVAPSRTGRHDVLVTWTDAANSVRVESIPIYVTLRREGGGSGGNDVTIINESRSSGCNSIAGIWALALPLLGKLFFLGKKKKVLFLCLLLAASLFLAPFSASAATTFVVRNAADDYYVPPPGSIRSILETIQLSGITGDIVIQFDPSVDTIELQGPLTLNSVTLDAFTGREGRRVTFTLARGGFRHILSPEGGVSGKGIILKGFGKGSARNTGWQNGGMEIRNRIASVINSVFEDSAFIDIVGNDAAIVIRPHIDAFGAPLADDVAITTSNVWFGGVTMDRCLFQGNIARFGPGAIDASQNQVMLFNSFIGHNVSAGSSGAISSTWASPTPSVHNTIVGNPPVGRRSADINIENSSTAPHVGNGGIFDGSLILKRSNFIGNESEIGEGALRASSLVLSNSTIYGNTGGSISGPVDFFASIIIDDTNNINNVALDPLTWNLTNTSHSAGSGSGTTRDVFELWPPQAERLGGYTQLIPITFAGPAEGRVPAALLSAINPGNYPWNFRTDARGVPRNHARGASVGSFEFGEVSLLPANIQNSTRLAFRPNETGNIRVKLVENINVPGFRPVTNFLSDVCITFELISGNSIEDLPQTATTADNGRANIVVNTLGRGENQVLARVTNKPSLSLNLTILVDEYAAIEDDDLYVVELIPNQTRVNTENTHIAIFSRACASSTVSIRLRGHTEYIARNLPITITDSIFGTIDQPLSFSERGRYMFDFTMTDYQGRTYTDTKELRVTDDDSALRVFRMSAPPFHVNSTFSLIASFTRAPREIDMTLTGPTGRVYRPTMHSRNNRLEWEGFYTPLTAGTYTARLEYVDGASMARHSEYFTIQVTEDTGGGGAGGGTTEIRTGGGGGCKVLGGGLLLLVLPYLLLVRRKWKA